MGTRAQVRFATREDGVSFSEHPDKIHAQFYVHSDGYPEGLGLSIAMSYADQEIIAAWQYLHDTKLAYQLQGWFGRTASDLIKEGIINK